MTAPAPFETRPSPEPDFASGPFFEALARNELLVQRCTRCGTFQLGDHTFYCDAYRNGGHGTLNLTEGIAKSCDVYFYDVGNRTGIDHIAKVAGVDHVGLGSDFDGVSGATPAGMNSAADLPKITQALLDRGYSADDIRKILGGNLLRVFGEVERISAKMQSVKADAH